MFGVCLRVLEEDRVSTLASRPSRQATSAGINSRACVTIPDTYTHYTAKTKSVIYKGLRTYFVHSGPCLYSEPNWLRGSGKRKKKHLSTRISTAHGDILTADTEHLCVTRAAMLAASEALEL